MVEAKGYKSPKERKRPNRPIWQKPTTGKPTGPKRGKNGASPMSPYLSP